MVQHATGDDGVERLRLELERDPPVVRPFGCARIDTEHVIAGRDEGRRDPALIATSHLENAKRGRR